MKKSFRQALVLALFALFAASVFYWFDSRKNPPHPISVLLAVPSPQTPHSTVQSSGSPNRAQPTFQPLDALPEIPPAPSDEAISGSRTLPDRLWPVGSAVANDNESVAELLRNIRGKSEEQTFQEIEKWIAAHRDSRWRLALQSQLMNFKWKTGWFATARAGWTEVWNSTRDSRDVNAYHLANDVLGRLLESVSGYDGAATLRQLVNDASKRPLNGPLEGKVFRAREAVWLLDHTAAQNVMCGPLALNAIKEYRGEPFIAPRLSQVPPEFQSTGLPLSEVQRFAGNDYKLPMKSARRSDKTQPIPTPAVMHVVDQHYCALLDRSEDGSKYLLADRTLQFNGWVDRAAVDSLSSGAFLIASANIPKGFDALSSTDSQAIYGRDGAHGTTPTDEATDDDDPKTDDNQCKAGMPTYTFHPIPGALRIGDIPLRYSPPVGPRVAFQINYNDADSGAPTSPPTWSHVGVTWSTNWVAWIEHVGTPFNGQQLRVRVPGGGTQVVKYNSATAKYGPHDQSFATVTRSGTFTYTREMPDGSKEVYDAPNNPTSPSRVFLSQIIDPQGNALTLSYDSNIRLVSVADAIGQVTTLSYGDTGNIYRITRVTDPFGRFCSLAYDTGGRLTGVTDQLGLATTFTYNASNGFIESMLTPYGTSTFNLPVNNTGSNRIVEATDPLGGKQRVEFNDTGTTFVPSLREPPASVMVGNTAVPFYAENTRLQFRNAWYWDKLANEVAPGDYKAAKNYRFYTTSNWQVVPVIESTKMPHEDRVWFNYPGGVGIDGSGFPYYLGASALPEKVLRMLPDGTPQLRQSYANAQGNTVKTVDPLGRTTEFSYAANGLDMTEIRQTTAGINERQMGVTYNTQHQPTTITDAAGSVTSYTYNPRGQVLTVTNALNEITTFIYDANGYLASVDGPLVGSADSTTFTYDSVGRIRTTTNSDGYTRTYSYDDFDRVTRIDYPDGTNERIAYEKLDRASFTDRLNRVTAYTHNSIRQMTQVTDPLLRTIKMDWCRCGSLASMTDPKGNLTRWQRDLQGRLSAKVYADNSKVVYAYDDAGRMAKRTDEKGQNKLFDYFADGAMKQVSYPNAQVATPTVSYTYDSRYPRVASMKDGIGTTLYAYHPAINAVAPGAGRLASVDGPFPDDTITYGYDSLGRATSRTINGVTSGITLDALGRTATLTDALGTFNFAYEGPTNRVLSMSRPNNVTTFYQYYDNSGDRQLKQIKHQRITDNRIISQFDYTYDAVGRILTWAQGEDGGVPDVWSANYDALDQLASVNVSRNGSSVTSFSYTYDPAGNRLSKTENGKTSASKHNGLNQLMEDSGSAQWGFTWDAEDRLATARLGDAVFQFRYDGTGRRREIMKTVDGKKTTSLLVWDGVERVQNRSADGATTHLFALGCKRVEGAMSNQVFYLKDHLGSIRSELLDNGLTGYKADYSPFGEHLSESGNSLSENGFQGHQLIRELSIYLAPFRAFSPESGKWLSRDPLEEGDGLNLYSFVRNNPLNLVDPTGLKVWRCKKPLDALGGGSDDNQRIGPDLWGNPLYHEFYCIELDGKTQCFGQTLDHDRDTNAGQWGTGKPSNDYYTPNRCEEESDEGNCLADCLKKKGSAPRPNYGLFGPGTNCQEWVDDQLSDCKKNCKNKGSTTGGPGPHP